jgi:ABC-type amino acid transport substrate-binding protein
MLVSLALADKLDDIKLRGKLLVGVSETTPPFSFRKPGDNTITGYDIDLVQAVAKRIGVALELGRALYSSRECLATPRLLHDHCGFRRVLWGATPDRPAVAIGIRLGAHERPQRRQHGLVLVRPGHQRIRS